jgi:histidinol-phosphate aminotransferase
VWPSDANFVCVEHPAAGELAGALRKGGIRVAPLHGIRRFPDEWPTGMRISVAPLEIEDRMISLLTQASASPTLA